MLVASDTDILVLLIYVIDRLSLLNIQHRIKMKFDIEKLVDGNNICSNLPEKVRKLLPAYHSITGLDKSSCQSRVEKVKAFTKALKKDKINLLQCFQNEEDKERKPAKKFVQIITYPGKDNESFAERRSQKSSSNLSRDQSSLDEHLKKAKQQTMIWNQCCKQNIVYPYPTMVG